MINQNERTSLAAEEAGRKPKESMAEWEAAGLSGEALVVEGAGALCSGQIALSSSVTRENLRLEKEGKAAAVYYELGLDEAAGLGPKAGSAEPVAVEAIRAVEGRLKGEAPAGLSVGELLNLEAGLEKADREAGGELTAEELRAMARAPMAIEQARRAGASEGALETALQEESARRAKLIAEAAQKARSQAGASVTSSGHGGALALGEWRKANELAAQDIKPPEGDEKGPAEPRRHESSKPKGF